MALVLLLRLLKRNAVVVVLGLMATVGALVALNQPSPFAVYQTRAGVLVSPPAQLSDGNPFYGREWSVTVTAWVLADTVSGDSEGARTTSSGTTLAGQGVREGYSVALVNNGGQWNYDYDRPLIDVQAVGSTPEETQASFDFALSELERTLTEMQDEYGVRPEDRLELSIVTGTPQITYGAGRPTRAMAAAALLGVAATLLLVLVSDDRRVRAWLVRTFRPSRRRTPAPGPAADLLEPVPAGS